MKKHSGEETVELVGPLGVEEGYHSADVVQALDLGAERGVLVEVAVDEVAVLLGSDPAASVDADAAGVAYDLADHVLGHLVLVAPDREVRVPVQVLLFRSVVKKSFV